MTDQPERYTSAQFYIIVGQQIADGLPAPAHIMIDGDRIGITFSSIADRDSWVQAFGAQTARVHEQPWPLDGPYVTWTTFVSCDWQGWFIALNADEPITDEQAQHWIDSGQAARRAEYVAREAAKGGEQRG